MEARIYYFGDMSFILVPMHGVAIKVNGWSWRPTIELIRAENLISDKTYERMGASACDGHVDAEVALRIADLVDRRLATMQPGERILGDLSVTSNPKNIVTFAPHTQPEEISVVDLYSASYDWLVTFRDFCRQSGGFKVL